MEKVIDLIKTTHLFGNAKRIGVGVSGGMDSMALLHFLHNNSEVLGIEVVAINVNHGTRENDEVEAKFVANYCKEAGIEHIGRRVDVGVIAQKEGGTLEDACRRARFAIFAELKEKGKIDMVALAHHQRDQAETILLHILRGSGLTGASGMSLLRDYVARPLLNTPKQDIIDYVKANNIPYLEDETNTDTTISRNLLRQEIMPKLRSVWPNLDNSLCDFGKICREDDQCIRKMVDFDAILEFNGVIKIPLTYFVYDKPIIYRMLFDSIKKLGVTQDFERKHYQMMINLAVSCENGSKLDLPQKVTAHKEYEYLTLTREKPAFNVDIEWPFKVGKIQFGDYGKLVVRRVRNPKFDEQYLVFDIDKIPNGAVWRVRREGDIIEKFGGGTKKLKSYLIDKKIPARLRNYLPVLAIGNDVLAVAGVDISEQLRVTEETKNYGIIKYDLENWA